MPFFDVKCKDQCGYEAEDVWASTFDKRPLCQCGGETETVWKPNRRAVIQDSIEGGVLIYNGICHEDGSPKRYYSHSEIRSAAEAKGLTPTGNMHVPMKGTDKAFNGYTTRWCLPSPISEEERLKHWHETEAQWQATQSS